MIVRRPVMARVMYSKPSSTPGGLRPSTRRSLRRSSGLPPPSVAVATCMILSAMARPLKKSRPWYFFRSSSVMTISPALSRTVTLSAAAMDLVARGDDADLDQELRAGELRLDRGARRRVAGRDPRIPHRVHVGEGA